MKIIHTADLHLDSSMKTHLEGDKATKRKDELTLNFARLCESAKDLGVKAIIIAGDLFDTKSVTKKVASIVLTQINKYKDIQFYYLRGNHDRESFISFIKGNGDVPANFHMFGDEWTSYVLNPESRHAAQDMQKRLGIPFIEMLRLYQPDKIHNQYKLLADAIGVSFNDSEYLDNTYKKIKDFKERHGSLKFAVGEILNGDAIEIALMLVKEGFKVECVFATIGELNYRFLKTLSELSPDTKVYSNLSPTMLNYKNDDIDCYIGSDCAYYFPDKPGIEWCDDTEPFGYQGVSDLFDALDEVLSK